MSSNTTKHSGNILNGKDIPPNLETDTEVIVPDPDEEDAWNNGFQGIIVDFRQDTNGELLAVVEDAEGDCWDVEIYRLENA